jgi:hypothetical protein
MTTMNEIPHEVKCKIMVFLNPKEILDKISVLNKKWNKDIQNDYIWNKFYKRYWEYETSETQYTFEDYKNISKEYYGYFSNYKKMFQVWKRLEKFLQTKS